MIKNIHRPLGTSCDYLFFFTWESLICVAFTQGRRKQGARGPCPPHQILEIQKTDLNHLFVPGSPDFWTFRHLCCQYGTDVFWIVGICRFRIHSDIWNFIKGQKISKAIFLCFNSSKKKQWKNCLNFTPSL